MEDSDVHADCTFSDFSYMKYNVSTQGLTKLVKISMLKALTSGADKFLKTKKSYPRKHSSLSLQNSSRFEDESCEIDTKWDEGYGDNRLYNRGGMDFWPLSFLSFLATMAMKSIGFQFGLVLSLVTFPIKLSYCSLMFFLFPLQTLSYLKNCLVEKLWGMWSAACSGVMMQLRIQGSTMQVGVRLTQALSWSLYVCSWLLGLLILGFVLGGFAMKQLVDKPVKTVETLNFDYTKSSPVAFVPIMSSDVVDSSVTTTSETLKQIGSRGIPSNQKLQLIVALTMPESEYNRKLGVFQVRVEFLSRSGNVLTASSYPAILRFKSNPIRLMETLFKSVQLLTGVQSETQTLSLRMSDFSQGLEPTACLKVLLQKRAEYQPQGAGIPEVYAASLAIETKLPQLKQLIWNWRRTVYVWISLVSFLTELSIVMIFCRPVILGRSRLKTVKIF